MTGHRPPLGYITRLNITDLYHRIQLFIFFLIILLILFFILLIILIIALIFIFLGGDFFLSSYFKRVVFAVGVPVNFSFDCSFRSFTEWLSSLSSTLLYRTLIISRLLVCKTKAY